MLDNCARMVLAIGCTCFSSVVAVVIVSLGAVCSGSVIIVKEKAKLPYSNNAHPRILPRIFWSTVFSLNCWRRPFAVGAA
jgi:hypothetical protein